MKNFEILAEKLLIWFLLIMIGLPLTAFAQSGVDLHWLWDDRCAACHGHSAEFSRQYLQIVDGQLQGNHHTDKLLLFLDNHYLNGRYSNEIYAMLSAQVSTPPRYKKECSACHQKASSLVREALLVQQGELILKRTGQRLQDFLDNHRRLKPEDVVFYVDLLNRIAVEVNLEESQQR